MIGFAPLAPPSIAASLPPRGSHCPTGTCPALPPLPCSQRDVTHFLFRCPPLHHPPAPTSQTYSPLNFQPTGPAGPASQRPHRTINQSNQSPQEPAEVSWDWAGGEGCVSGVHSMGRGTVPRAQYHSHTLLPPPVPRDLCWLPVDFKCNRLIDSVPPLGGQLLHHPLSVPSCLPILSRQGRPPSDPGGGLLYRLAVPGTVLPFTMHASPPSRQVDR